MSQDGETVRFGKVPVGERLARLARRPRALRLYVALASFDGKAGDVGQRSIRQICMRAGYDHGKGSHRQAVIDGLRDLEAMGELKITPKAGCASTYRLTNLPGARGPVQGEDCTGAADSSSTETLLYRSQYSASSVSDQSGDAPVPPRARTFLEQENKNTTMARPNTADASEAWPTELGRGLDSFFKQLHQRPKQEKAVADKLPGWMATYGPHHVTRVLRDIGNECWTPDNPRSVPGLVAYRLTDLRKEGPRAWASCGCAECTAEVERERARKAEREEQERLADEARRAEQEAKWQAEKAKREAEARRQREKAALRRTVDLLKVCRLSDTRLSYAALPPADLQNVWAQLTAGRSATDLAEEEWQHLKAVAAEEAPWLGKLQDALGWVKAAREDPIVRRSAPQRLRAALVDVPAWALPAIPAPFHETELSGARA